jgi:hypothetical protein
MNCQMFSTGLSSGDLGGSGIRVMLSGMSSLSERCQPVEQQHGVGSGGDGLGDFFQMQRHGGGIAARQNEAGCGSLSRTDGTEDVGGARALIVWCRGPCPAPRPSPCDLVFLADPGLVLKPDLYRLADCLATSDLVEALGKVFLNVAMASAS